MSIMLHQLPSSSPFLFSCLFIFLFILLLQYWKRTQAHNYKLPPGPWKLPFIGNLHQFIGSGSIAHKFMRDLALKYGPIMHLQFGELSTILISSPEAARQVLKTHELTFADRPTDMFGGEVLTYDYSGILFTPYGSNWRNIRKICVTKLLSSTCVNSFRSIREEEVWNLIDSISSSQGLNNIPINISKMIPSMVNNATCKAVFGNKCKDQDQFLLVLHEIVLFVGAFSTSNLLPSLKFLHSIRGINSAVDKLHRKMDKILVDIIDDHKIKRKANGKPAGDREDLVDKLLQLQESRELEFDITDNHIKSITMDMLAAGTDTSSTVIEWAMSELVRNPKVMERAQTEVRQVLKGKRKIEEIDIQGRLDYLKLVIKETLRLHPPVTLIARASGSGDTCEINGYEIPPKTRVLINVWAMGRDPKHWINADCFQPERFSDSSIDFKGTNDFSFIPFGAGKWICPGMSFGIATIELALAQLLYHFDWKIPYGIKPEELDMTENLGVTCMRRNDLHLIAVPCIPFPYE